MKPMQPMAPMQPMEPMDLGPAWWPVDFGEPSSSGGQNEMRYAFFAEARRLVIEDGGKPTVYDTGDHRINGVAQAQSSSRSLAFTSQAGEVRLEDLKKLD